jgi:hypothetical protein
MVEIVNSNKKFMQRWFSMRAFPGLLAVALLAGCQASTTEGLRQTETAPIQTNGQSASATSNVASDNILLTEALLESGRAAAAPPRPQNDRAIAAFDTLIDTHSNSPVPELRRIALLAGLEKAGFLLTFTPPHSGLAADITQKVLQTADTVPNGEMIKLVAFVYRARALSLKTPSETNEITRLTQEGLSLAETVRARAGKASEETTPFYAELLYRDASQKARGFYPDTALPPLARLIDNIAPSENDAVSRRYLAEGRLLRAGVLTAATPPRWADAAADYRAVRPLAAGQTNLDLEETALLARVRLAEMAPKLGPKQIGEAEQDINILIRDRTATPHIGIRKATAQSFIVLADFALQEKPPAPSKAVSYLMGLERYTNERMNEEMRYYWVIALTTRAKIIMTYFPNDHANALALYDNAEQWRSMTKNTPERDRLVAQTAMDYAEALITVKPPRRAEAVNVLNRAQTMFWRLRNPSNDPLFAQLIAMRARIEATP